MPLNPNIALAGRDIDTANPLMQFAETKRQKERDASALKQQETDNQFKRESLDLQKKNSETDNQLRMQQLANAKFESLDARNQARLRDTIVGSAQLNTFLQAGDMKGAESFLVNRKKSLGQRIANGEDVDTVETDDALRMLREDPKGLKALTGESIKLGQMLKVLQAPGMGDGSPSSVREFEYYNSLPDDQKQSYINVKRQNLVPGTFLNQQTGNAEQIPGFSAAKAGIEGDTAAAKEGGKIFGEKQSNFPKLEETTNYSIKLIDDLLNDPGLQGVIGVPNLQEIVPGTEEKGFLARLEQIKGRQFLEAYERLKGGGQITEIEGNKAEQAIARLNRSQSEKDFTEAAMELRGILVTGLERARGEAGASNNTQNNAQSPSSGGIKFLGFE